MAGWSDVSRLIDAIAEYRLKMAPPGFSIPSLFFAAPTSTSNSPTPTGSTSEPLADAGPDDRNRCATAHKPEAARSNRAGRIEDLRRLIGAPVASAARRVVAAGHGVARNGAGVRDRCRTDGSEPDRITIHRAVHRDRAGRRQRDRAVQLRSGLLPVELEGSLERPTVAAGPLPGQVAGRLRGGATGTRVGWNRRRRTGREQRTRRVRRTPPTRRRRRRSLKRSVPGRPPHRRFGQWPTTTDDGRAVRSSFPPPARGGSSGPHDVRAPIVEHLDGAKRAGNVMGIPWRQRIERAMDDLRPGRRLHIRILPGAWLNHHAVSVGR